MAHKSYRPRPDADERFQSILAAVLAIRRMPEIVLRSHRKRLLNSCLWQLTQSKAFGKYNLRFATTSARRLFELGQIEKLHHEHVYTRKQMIGALLATNVDDDQVAEILQKACGCLVTRDQHHKLSKDRGKLDGWERYQRAGFRIYDRLEKRNIPFAELLGTSRRRSEE